jgi:transcription initiation factor TFIIF subunit beta
LQISLRLDDLPQSAAVPKDYTLMRQNVNADKSPLPVSNTFVFTEKDLPGYKSRGHALFDDTRAHSHGRSFLYEQTKRDAKKKENKKKWEPYTRKTIPSKISLSVYP